MNNETDRALMIGAHPDDCEFLAGGTALKLAQKGYAVKFLSLTNGNTGHYEKSGAELAAIRKAEMNASCKIAGIECQVLDIGSNTIEADIPTRERVIRLIREYRPRIIFTHRTNDYHPDHRRTAILVQDSSYAIRVPNVCRDTPCLRYSPIIMYMFDNFKKPIPFTADVAVGIDEVIHSKARMLDCHVSQMYEWMPWIDGYAIPEDKKKRFDWLYESQIKRDAKTADMFRDLLTEKYGPDRKVQCAEAFEISEYGRRPEKDEMDRIFSF